MKTVLFYRSDLLPPSETFIHAQASHLQRYQSHFVGLRTVPTGLLDAELCTVAERTSLIPARLRDFMYGTFGLHPIMQSPAFLQHLRALNPVLMHAQFATDAVTALPLAMHLKIPMIVSMHGYDVTVNHEGRNPLRNVLQRHRRRALQQYASQFLCISSFIRNKALALGFPDNKTSVHALGIDTKLFRPSAESSTSQCVVFVARLTEKKGCAYLIRAMQLVQMKVPSATLSIIGDGPLRSSLQTLAKQLDIRCNFLGRQDYESVRHHIATARVLCVPSVTAANGDSEGLGMVFAEAHALGVPVCSTRHGGVPEVVLHGHTGLLCPERNIETLAVNLVRLLTDDLFHAACSQHGRVFIEQHYDLRKQGEALERVYDEVLARHAAAIPSHSLAAEPSLARGA